MNILFLPLALSLSLGASMAQAQVSIHLDIGLPITPRLVLVAPGIQVVEAFPEEVFFHQGWYWCRRPDGWYRARSPRARFDWVEVRRVPHVLVQVPVGHYRQWHPGDRRHNEPRESRMERRDDQDERREFRQERKDHRESKHEKRDKRGRGNSEGRDHDRHEH